MTTLDEEKIHSPRNKPKRLTLKEKFLLENDGKTLTTDEIYEWYLTNKNDPSILPDRSQPHRLIIDPLLHNDRITKIERGRYIISPRSIAESIGALTPSIGAVSESTSSIEDDEDEFDRWVKSKIK